jgi:hypothetical protein
MARPSIQTARQWAPKAIRDRLPGGRRTGLAARLPGGKSRSRPLKGPKAAAGRRRRQGWVGGPRRRTAGGLGGRTAAMRGRVPSMPKPPKPPSVSMPSMPSVSMPSVSMPSVSMPSMPKRSRRRRRSRRMAGNLGVLMGAGAGYVLGTKAGRERYQQIVEQARQLWQRPQVRDTVAKGRDRVGSGVEKAAATAGDRLHQVRERSEQKPAPSPNGPGRTAATPAPGPSAPGATPAPGPGAPGASGAPE